MRMLMTVEVDTQAGNRAVKDGTLGRVMEKFVAQFKPEASYFTANGGQRTAFFVFDLPDPSQMPLVAEPFWMALNAKVDAKPVMNAEELGRGLQALAQSL